MIGDEDTPERVKGMLAASKLSEKNGLLYWHWKFRGDHTIPYSDMKKAHDLLLGKNGNETTTTVQPAPSAAEKTTGVIILYGRESCGLCRAMRRNLDSVGIAYIFHDVDTDNNKNLEMWKKVRSSFPDIKSVTFPVVDIFGLTLISPSFEEVSRYR